MHEIHAPVPDFTGGTRNAELIDAHVRQSPPEITVIRWNWSIYGDDRSVPPRGSPQGRRFGAGEPANTSSCGSSARPCANLPQSRDILFTIRIHVDPLAALEQHPDAAPIAASLIAQLEALSDAQVAYKGLTLERGPPYRAARRTVG